MTKAVGFQDVDKSGDAGAFVVYLDTVGSVDAVQTYKRRILGALGLRAGMRALDVGCGTGDNAALLAARGMRVTGFDVAPAAIEAARARYGDLGGLYARSGADQRSRWPPHDRSCARTKIADDQLGSRRIPRNLVSGIPADRATPSSLDERQTRTEGTDVYDHRPAAAAL